jgi:hypothetical protein
MRSHKVTALRGLLASLPLLFGMWSAEVRAVGTPLHQESAETCKLCHKEVYQQWKGSMHAQSTALSDPIHGTFYKKEIGEPTEEGAKMKNGMYPACLMCHAPNAARDMKTKLDALPAYSEGVNCVACHTMAKYKGIVGPEGKPQLGVKAYEFSDKLQAPAGFPQGLQKLSAGADPLFGGALAGGDDKKPNPHLGKPVMLEGKEIPALTMEQNPQIMKTSDVCMGCHDKRGNPQNVPLCNTGQEYAEGQTKVNCLSCHMPVAGGMADHGMGGGHDKAMLKRSVVFKLDAKAEGEVIKAAVSLQNLNPHRLPTGAPFRNMTMKLTAYDASGKVVWENFKEHPVKEDPQAYLMYEMLDDTGAHTMPPMATKLGPDTRLKAFETRVLNYDIPAKGVALVRGELFFNLLWPDLVEKFKQLPKELTTPVSVAVAEAAF